MIVVLHFVDLLMWLVCFFQEKKDSATLVYVSNLSFDVDDAALAKLFDGLTIKSAHVAVRRNGKSKGFGKNL
jgi:RNA recognition motif-containing protein